MFDCSMAKLSAKIWSASLRYLALLVDINFDLSISRLQLSNSDTRIWLCN